MQAHPRLIQAILVMAGMFVAAVWLRKRGVVRPEHVPVLAGIITDLVIPAVVFVSLATTNISLERLELPLVLGLAEVFCMGLAYGVGRLLGLDRPRLGTLMLCSAFGSSTLMGYAVIKEAMGTQPEAMVDAVLISEMGVGFPIFTVGVLVAIYFGSAETAPEARRAAMAGFFRSPVFVALVAGLGWSGLGLPTEGLVLTPVFEIGRNFGHALTALAALTVGLMLERIDVRPVLWACLSAVALKLLVQPFLAGGVAVATGLPGTGKDVLVIMAGMPAATLAAVFSRRYGCDGALASSLILATTFLSGVTLAGVFLLFA